MTPASAIAGLTFDDVIKADAVKTDDATAIVARLEEHSDDRAREAGALLRTKSPLSVRVALEANGASVRHATLESDFGHGAFVYDVDGVGDLLKRFLAD